LGKEIESVLKSDIDKKWLKMVSPQYTVEKWDCPLFNVAPLEFDGMLALDGIRFYFSDNKATVYVVSIVRGDPFRVVSESYFMAVYSPIQVKAEELKLPFGRTWKIWHSKFLEEINYSDLLFASAPEEDRFQYFIGSDDECIEFVSGKVNVEVFSDTNFEKVFEKDVNTSISLFKSDLEAKK
jgi:hypothetical protein